MRLSVFKSPFSPKEKVDSLIKKGTIEIKILREICSVQRSLYIGKATYQRPIISSKLLISHVNTGTPFSFADITEKTPDG